ncbi:MAG: autotransporter-associated beta strand repeat-containing protein [Verrucomicrobiae bacterium]|nr:autotransporter-associated beta strand repeat-containing protein [Verrucomicrobiae bacterium]
MSHLIFFATPAWSGDGAWGATGFGLWSTPENWVGGIIADGIDHTANFNMSSAQPDLVVSLDGPRTIGHLFFEESWRSDGNRTIDGNGKTANVLTIEATSSPPSIDLGRMGPEGVLEIRATVSGASGLHINNAGWAGTVLLGGANTFSGGTTVHAGTLRIDSDAALGAAAGGISFSDSGSALQAGADNIRVAATRTIHIGRDSDDNPLSLAIDSAGHSLAVEGPIVGPGTLHKTGAGVLELLGTNTYAGDTFIDKGVLAIRGDDALGNPAGAIQVDISGTLRADADFTLGASRTIKVSTDAAYDVPAVLTIDTNGRALRIAGDIVPVDPGSPGGTVVKSGIGTLTLAGANNCGGDILVEAGNLELAGSGSLTFVPTARGTSNKLTGPAAAVLGGTLVIDLTSADIADGNTWTLVDVADPTYNLTAITSNPPLAFARDASGAWSASSGSMAWTFTEADGVLALAVAPPAGYSAWVADHPGLPDTTPAADPDHDGMPNLLEYVLNGDPRASDPAIQPRHGDPDARSFVFTFKRRTTSAADTNQVFEYGTDLSFGQTINVTAPTGPGVSIGTDVAGQQAVTITIPKDGVDADRLFGRLKVTQP